MRLNRDDDASNFLHAVFWRIIWLLLYYAFPLHGLGPVLFENAFVDPFLPRSIERLRENATRKCILVEDP
jgi:hypothetical protein